MNRPSLVNSFIEVAEIFSKRSTCNRLSVGCVITNSEMTSILSIGYNGNAKGLNNCCDSDEPGNCGCIHSEVNALIKCDYSIKNKKMFVTHSPCKMCCKLIINAGISHVYYLNEYRDMSALQILHQSGVFVSSLLK